MNQTGIFRKSLVEIFTVVNACLLANFLDLVKLKQMNSLENLNKESFVIDVKQCLKHRQFFYGMNLNWVYYSVFFVAETGISENLKKLYFLRNKEGKQSQTNELVFLGIGSVSSACLIYPFDKFRTIYLLGYLDQIQKRENIQNLSSQDKSTFVFMDSIRERTKQIVPIFKEHGLRNLYRGFVPFALHLYSFKVCKLLLENHSH